MYTFKVALFCALASFPLISNALSVGVQVNSTSEQVQQVRDMFTRYPAVSSISDEAAVPDSEITWNPQLITDKPLLTQLCANNLPGNYQNPFNCNQFIMCTSDGSVYLWECPGGGMYDPFADLCVYPPRTIQDSCPWWSGTWNNPSTVCCETVGQRLYWSYLTLPAVPSDRCSPDIHYCKKFERRGVGKCPRGFGFSRAYLACLEISKCHQVDSFFYL